MTELSFSMIKPDCVQRNLVGRVIQRFEEKRLKLRGLKLVQINRPLAERLYDVHKERPFFGELVDFIISGPVVVMVVEGPEAIKVVRNLLGATKSADAAPGTIRGDFGITTGKNIVHASDAIDRAKYEMGLFFKPEELLSYSKVHDPWL